MPLLALPNELLNDIAHRLFSQTDLDSLMQTNHRCYCLLNAHLYRHNARWFNSTARLWSAECGQMQVIQKSIREGGNIQTRNTFCETPLLLACRGGHKGVVKLLLEHVDPDATNDDGRTSLSIAAEHGHESVVQLLICHHADLQIKNDDGRSPVLWAACSGHDTIVKLFLEQGLDPDCSDTETLTIEVRYHGQQRMATEKCTGMSPLLWALHRGDGAIVALFSNKKFSHCPPHMHKKPRRHRRRRFSSCKIPVTPGEAHKAYE
ncbi:hypothetical protein RU639_012669 [Aspergillus parasiticus]